MDEYIKRKAAIDAACDAVELYRSERDAIEDSINKIPAADVVSVVRYKECKNYKKNPYSNEDDNWCMCWPDWIPTDPDDFCSYGERKEGTYHG